MGNNYGRAELGLFLSKNEADHCVISTQDNEYPGGRGGSGPGVIIWKGVSATTLFEGKTKTLTSTYGVITFTRYLYNGEMIGLGASFDFGAVYNERGESESKTLWLAK